MEFQERSYTQLVLIPSLVPRVSWNLPLPAAYHRETYLSMKSTAQTPAEEGVADSQVCPGDRN